MKRRPDLVFKRLTPARMNDFRDVQSGNRGNGCWCMYPRLTAAMQRELPGAGSASEKLRDAMEKLARRRRAPGLLAYEGDKAVGWIAIGPRAEMVRVDRSRTTPRVDDADVWVIPCISVHRKARGRGIALALIDAAVSFAFEAGAPAVEAYPRAGNDRVGDYNAYFGTEPLFRRAGFRVIRKPLERAARNWIPRVTMRV